MRLLLSRLPQLSQLAKPAAVLGVLLFALYSARPSRMIYNDVAVAQRGPVASVSASSATLGEKALFLVNFEQMTVGLITGLLLGVIAGKLSLVFVLLLLSSYFLVAYLENKGIIDIPWKKIIRVGRENISIKLLVFEKPSFKVPFVLSFLIAAYNI